MTKTVPKEKYDELQMKLNAWKKAYSSIYEQLDKLRKNIQLNMRILQ